MKKFFGILLFCVLSQAFAASTDTVRILNASTMTVTGLTDTTFTLGSDTPSGDAASEGTAGKVYVPIKISATLNQEKYFSLYNSGVHSLYEISSSPATTSANYSKKINFPLTVTSTSGSTYLYAAVKLAENSYAVIAKYSETPFDAGTTAQEVYFSVSPQDICDRFFATSTTTCNSLITTSTSEIDPVKFYVYFFQSTSNWAVVDHTGFDPKNQLGGGYFEVQMSNRVYASTDLTVNISPLKIGDGRLIINFSTTSQMSSDLFKKVLAFKHTTGYAAGGSPIGDYIGEILDPNYAAQSGEITVSPLINNTPYNLSVFLLDKFKFSTSLSPSESGIPLQIEELLKKQACFLLTAGFGEEHYVIEYFRNFRDHMLAKSWLGRKFINFYYETAPKYALIIYKSNILRSVIRGVAYCLYFIFNYITLLSIGFASIISFIILKRVKKWQHQKKMSLF